MQMGQNANSPSPEDTRRYRQLAEDADACAMQVNGSVREAYALMAEEWRRLAKAAEQAALGGPNT
jgi:hypothetical protein